MLAIEVELLTGRYVATAYNDRDTAEWPPHPARLYSALVATWAFDGQRDDERAALEWLAAQPPPTVFSSEAFPRTPVPVFVPVNDVQTIAEPTPAREAMANAAAALVQAGANGQAREQAAKALAKALKRLAADTEKQIAPPMKETAEDLKRARAVLPESRIRQPRAFPSVTPVEPCFVVAWEPEPPAKVRKALKELCVRLVCVGHSSSFVRARLVEEVQGEALVPDEDGPEVLRVPRKGQLDALVTAHKDHQGVEPRVLPCAFVRYRLGGGPAAREVPRSLFGDDWIVFSHKGGDRFPITAIVELARAFRSGLLKHADEPIPPILTGHGPDASPVEEPHVALVPLPFVGSAFADGQILGVAVILPRNVDDEGRRAVLRAIGRWEEKAREEGRADVENPPLKLTLGPAGVMLVERLAFGRPLKATLRTRAWARPARLWATATPIALDRNPGDLGHLDPRKRSRAFDEAEETVRLACERIGLPRPTGLDVLRSAVLPGSEKPNRFPPFPREREKTQRVLVHARLVFAEPVQGPVLLGAGRFFGLGLCRPLDGRDEEA